MRPTLAGVTKPCPACRKGRGYTPDPMALIYPMCGHITVFRLRVRRGKYHGMYTA